MLKLNSEEHMSGHSFFQIKCDTISYRKGFLEVTPGIHDGCVNIETWEIDASANLDDKAWIADPSIPDSCVTANTELELTTTQARKFAEAILAAVKSVEKS